MTIEERRPGAVVAIWNGITDEARDEFYLWHESEHMPERVGIAGFLRGRRYRAVHGAPEFFTRYDLAGSEVLTSEAYLARLNAPTQWTRRVLPHFRDTSRALCKVALSTGCVARPWLCTIRIGPRPARCSATAEALHAAASTAAELQRASVHLLEADEDASSVETSEQRMRQAAALFPRWTILAECRSLQNARQIDALLRKELSDRAGLTAIEAGIYLLEYDLS